MDTYGRMGKPFLKLIKDIADHQAHRTSGAVNAHTQGVHTEEPPPLEFRNKAYLHSIALVHASLISTTTMACRFQVRKFDICCVI
jgi:hypothetical protein